MTKNNQHFSSHQSEQHLFSCGNCGAGVNYRIGTNQLSCQACGHTEYIDENGESIDEYPLEQALSQLSIQPLQPPVNDVSCDNCSATSTWDINSLSDLCPYCKTPIAKLDTAQNRIQVEAIVPFSVEKSLAFKQFSQWLKKRWLAPSVLKEMTGHSKQFEGVYVPHWTFDSLTHTSYRGQRGVNYTDYVTRTRIVNGKQQTVTVPVTRTRWYPASGRVRVMFDDVLVLASMLIPKIIINKLSPWQLNRAEPYTPAYLAGLKAKYYQLNLDDAFRIAQHKMAIDIKRAIRRDIGGDHQKITQSNTRHQNSTYKLMLLPVWYSSFEYKGKTYKTVINGQTGKVAGQYPKSAIKIAALAVIVIILSLAVGYFIIKDVNQV